MRNIVQIVFVSLLVMSLTSCNPSNVSTQDVGMTETPTSESSPTSDTSIILSRANAQRTGAYDLPAMRQQPEIAWKVQISSTWLMPPLLAEGILYTGSGDGVLYALNAETGEKLWSAGGFDALESTGAVGGDVIVTAGFSQLVKAMDRKTGQERWTYRTEYDVQGAPLIVDDRVYIATDRRVYALDLESGKEIWKVSTGTEGAFMGAPAYQDGVIYTTGGKLLLALDAESGNELWRVEKDEMFLGLAVADQHVYVGNWDKHLYAFNQADGEELWSFEASGTFWSAPAADENTIYAGNIDKYLYALDAQTGKLQWSFKTGRDAVSEPLLAGGVVYVSDSSHLFPSGASHVYALDAVTGEQLWVYETVSTFLPAPELGNGTMYVTSSGEVIALK